MEPILYYTKDVATGGLPVDGKYYEFSNFYVPETPFKIESLDWVCIEAYFQAKKWFSPNNNIDTCNQFMYYLSKCTTPTQAYVLGKGKFLFGEKMNWYIKNVPSILYPKNFITMNEIIAIFTTCEINETWRNFKLLSYLRNEGRTLINTTPLTFDKEWWEKNKVELMKTCLTHKFTSPQHPQFGDLLKSTNDKQIRHHTINDKFWGDGGIEGGGHNILGQILMHIRSDTPINLEETSAPLNTNRSSYVKLSDTLYFGIHPGLVPPNIDIDHYVNLIPDEESRYQFNHPNLHHCPISHRRTPSVQDLSKIVDLILSLQGSVYIYCRGGHGRSGTIAAAVYGRVNNLNGDQAIHTINQQWHLQRDLNRIKPLTRSLGCPQTYDQKRLVKIYLQ